MSSFLKDLTFALRLLRKKPLFTAIVVGTLALGIGLNSAVFSAIEALLLRPLPGVRAPNELVQLYRTWPGDVKYGSNSIPHFRDVRERTADVFSGAAAWTFSAVSLATGDRAERVMGQIVSANFFHVLGVGATKGRVFGAEEEVGDLAHPVAVLSHSAWRTRFGGDEGIVGRSVILNGSPYTIIGVAPEDFRGAMPVLAPELWVPLVQLAHVRPGSATSVQNRGSNFMNVVARRAPGISVEQARARMEALASELLADFPDAYKDTGINLVPQDEAGIHPMFRSAQVGMSGVIMAVVVLLLLIACVNVANLFLARAQDRWREMAVRLSIGARRAVLVRQLLTESLVFALLSGGAGLLVAWWAIGVANRIQLPVDGNITWDLQLSVPVLLFTLGVTIATALVFGLVPALQATRPALLPSLKGEAPAGGSRSRLSRALVVTQMALSLVLLVCAGLFLRNLTAATSVEKGFDSDNLLLASMDPGLQGYTRAQSEAFYARLTERLRQTPGVRAVGLADEVPLNLSSSDRRVEIPGYTPQPNEGMSIFYTMVSDGYFEAMGIPIAEGRPIEARDDSASAPVIVVNQRFAERFWPGASPLGKVVRTAGRERTVVGVVPTGKYRRMGEDPTAYMYLPQSQVWTSGMVIHVRAAGDPTAMIPVLRTEVAALDPNLPLSDVRTMTAHLGTALLPARLAGTVLGIFGILGLTLAAVGMYGVMSYAVAQRTREIGIRMAIGAGQAKVLGLVMRQGLALVAIGGLIGIAGAGVAARLVRSVLYGENAFDPVTFVGVPVVLLAVAALAIWVPARRATKVDPVLALRAD